MAKSVEEGKLWRAIKFGGKRLFPSPPSNPAASLCWTAHNTGGVAWIIHQVSSRPNVADFDTPFRNWRIEWLGKNYSICFSLTLTFPFSLFHRVSTTHLTTNGSCCTQKKYISHWSRGKRTKTATMCTQPVQFDLKFTHTFRYPPRFDEFFISSSFNFEFLSFQSLPHLCNWEKFSVFFTLQSHHFSHPRQSRIAKSSAIFVRWLTGSPYYGNGTGLCTVENLSKWIRIR